MEPGVPTDSSTFRPSVGKVVRWAASGSTTTVGSGITRTLAAVLDGPKYGSTGASSAAHAPRIGLGPGLAASAGPPCPSQRRVAALQLSHPGGHRDPADHCRLGHHRDPAMGQQLSLSSHR